MPCCVAIGCTYDKSNPKKFPEGKKITFHRFPKDKELSQLWVNTIKRDEWAPTDHSRICSVHFEEDCFDRSSPFVTILKPGSVPTLFPGLPSYLQPFLMTKVGLNLSCSVDHIDELQTGPNYCWNLKFQCRTCNESDDIWHSVSPDEEVKGKAGPGTFNFQMKCKFCSNVFTIDVLKETIKALKSGNGDKINNQTIVVFECRGAEPIDFDPQDGWLGKCDETGSKFDDIDFTQDTCWAGYDEKGKFPVSVDDMSWKFIRV